MRRINTANKAADLFGAGKHGWKNGLAGTTNRPTEGQAEWFNEVQEELARAVEASGQVVTPGNLDQLGRAIRLLGVADLAVDDDEAKGLSIPPFVPRLKYVAGSVGSAINDMHVNLGWFMTEEEKEDWAQGTLEIDFAPLINDAIDFLGGSYDLESAYEYEPAKVLHLPKGKGRINSRLFVNKNNVRIYGDGSFATTLVCARTLNLTEMMRFQGAYGCELSYLTLDGGLPFTPNGTETFGATICLTLDQTAHFRSVDLNICNYRLEGIRKIHVWEYFFENLRIFNGGFFGNSGTPSAAIRFTQAGKEDLTFPGGESNNGTYNKTAFGVVGTYVRADEVPVLNVHFNDVIAEGRTWATQWAATHESKWRLGATTAHFTVNNAYTFAHEQYFECNATLIEALNFEAGVAFNNYRVFNAVKDGGFAEITRIFRIDSSHPLRATIDIEDRAINSSQEPIPLGTVLLDASVISTLEGWVSFHSNSPARTKASLFSAGSESRYSGGLHFFAGASGTDVGINYRYEPRSQRSIARGNQLIPAFDCSAWFRYNGATNTLNAGGNIAGIARTATGQFTATFASPMPSGDYAVSLTIAKTGFGDDVEIASQTALGFSFAVRNDAGVYANAPIICCAVHI